MWLQSVAFSTSNQLLRQTIWRATLRITPSITKIACKQLQTHMGTCGHLKFSAIIAWCSLFFFLFCFSRDAIEETTEQEKHLTALSSSHTRMVMAWWYAQPPFTLPTYTHTDWMPGEPARASTVTPPIANHLQHRTTATTTTKSDRHRTGWLTFHSIHHTGKAQRIRHGHEQESPGKPSYPSSSTSNMSSR